MRVRLPKIILKLPRGWPTILLAVGTVTAVAVVSVALYRRYGPDAGVSRPAFAAIPQEEDKPLIEVDQPVLEQYGRGGQLAWRIKLDQIALRSGGGLVQAQRIKEGIIYDDKGAPAIRVSAEQARVNVASKDFVVSGQCRAVTQGGAVMTTDKVQWINQERRLHFPDEVVLRHGDVVITTRGMYYSPDDRTVRAPQQVRAQTRSNTAIGRNMRYNLDTQDLEMQEPAIVVRNPKEAQQSLDQLRTR